MLHLTFHKGTMREIEGIAREVGWSVETWLIPELAPRFFDETSSGLCLYNIGHDRAERIWIRHADFFNQFDAIITSDTAALARIFLQNGYAKPLIIWISNRFDYHDATSLDCAFPDKEFYRLMNTAKTRPNVTVVATCPFEHYYARKKGVDTGSYVIKPCGASLEAIQTPTIPSFVNKRACFFLPSYHNEKKFMDLETRCMHLNIPTYAGRFAAPMELQDFKGVIHLPYSWCTIALFMNTQMGLGYFVPSKKFVKSLQKKGNYWHQNSEFLFDRNKFYLSEWYSQENKELFVYFNSWKDLKNKIAQTDFAALRRRVTAAAMKHKATMIDRWKELFAKIEKKKKES